MSDFNHDSYNDDYIRAILQESKTIAMVGASARTSRPSYFVLKYLLADVPVNIDMVDIFRNSQAADAITDEAIAINAKIVWMQLSVRNDEAAHRAQVAGLKVVMNRCPKIEYGRLSGEINWMGVNSRTLSSKKPHLSGTRVQSFGLGRPKT